MKKLILKICPEFILREYVWYRRVQPICRQLLQVRKKFTKCYILIATPSHGNLGDQAIVYAQRKLLEKLGFGAQIIEFSNEYYNTYKHRIIRLITSKDTIIIDGGGNLGSIWPENERKMQEVVSIFPENQVIIFPNTLFYGQDEEAQKLLEASKYVYNAHAYLTMIARDETSYRAMQDYYPSIKTLLTPDIVLSLNAVVFKDKARKGALLCLRDDRERAMNAQATEISKLLESNDLICDFGSTLVEGGVNQTNRASCLYKKFEEFSGYQVVVTDRLHAMIFCALTGTPCVAIDNTSKKVSGVFRWIQYLPYIIMVEKASEIMPAIKQVIGKEGIYYHSLEVEKAFRLIEELLI